MAMSGEVLGASIATALGVTDAVAIAQLKLMATAIVTHFQTQAVVTTTVTGTATGAVGGGAGVPVTGSAVGTIA